MCFSKVQTFSMDQYYKTFLSCFFQEPTAAVMEPLKLLFGLRCCTILPPLAMLYNLIQYNLSLLKLFKAY